MSERLARIASRVARKRARGRPPSEWMPSNGSSVEDTLWPDIPEAERIARVETLPGGTVSITYLDTLADFVFIPDEPEEEPEPAPPAFPQADPQQATRAAQFEFRGQLWD